MMKANTVLKMCMGLWLLFAFSVFAVTVANATHDVKEKKEFVNNTDDHDGYVLFHGDLPIIDPWKELHEQWERRTRKQQEWEERRICGRDAHLSIVDPKCNATFAFDLPANTTISLRKHLRSHARLKRRVLTLERMMRVVMAYQKLGVGLRVQQQQQRDKK